MTVRMTYQPEILVEWDEATGETKVLSVNWYESLKFAERVYISPPDSGLPAEIDLDEWESGNDEKYWLSDALSTWDLVTADVVFHTLPRNDWPEPGPFDPVPDITIMPKSDDEPLPLEYHFGVQAERRPDGHWSYHAYRHHNDDDACTHEGFMDGETVWDPNVDDWRKVEHTWPVLGPLEEQECDAVDSFNERYKR